METKKVLDTLNGKLPEINKKFENINLGGCGVFAYLLHTMLENKGVESKVVLINPHNFKMSFNHLKEQTNNSFDVNQFMEKVGYLVHLMVLIDNRYVDSTGVYDCLSLHPNSSFSNKTDNGEFPIGSLKNLIDCTNAWNDIFDRAQIPAIEKELEILVEEIL